MSSEGVWQSPDINLCHFVEYSPSKEIFEKVVRKKRITLKVTLKVAKLRRELI